MAGLSVGFPESVCILRMLYLQNIVKAPCLLSSHSPVEREKDLQNRFWCGLCFTSTCKPPRWSICSRAVDSASFTAAILEKLFDYHLLHTLVHHPQLITLIQHG